MELYREKSRQIPDITGEHVSRMVEKLAKYLAGPDFGEHVAGHMPHESVSYTHLTLPTICSV